MLLQTAADLFKKSPPGVHDRVAAAPTAATTPTRARRREEKALAMVNSRVGMRKKIIRHYPLYRVGLRAPLACEKFFTRHFSFLFFRFVPNKTLWFSPPCSRPKRELGQFLHSHTSIPNAHSTLCVDLREMPHIDYIMRAGRRVGEPGASQGPARGQPGAQPPRSAISVDRGPGGTKTFPGRALNFIKRRKHNLITAHGHAFDIDAYLQATLGATLCLYLRYETAEALEAKSLSRVFKNHITPRGHPTFCLI